MDHDLALFGRIALATVLGFAVGWEREVRGQPAGDRTFSLVGLGSAALTVLAVDAFPSTAEKLIAGIVTGVGFIGAGLILHTARGETKGITTAAGIWATAATGVLAGAGRVFLATAVTVLILLMLELRNIPLLRLVDARRFHGRVSTEDVVPHDPPVEAKPSSSSRRRQPK